MRSRGSRIKNLTFQEGEGMKSKFLWLIDSKVRNQLMAIAGIVVLVALPSFAQYNPAIVDENGFANVVVKCPLTGSRGAT